MQQSFTAVLERNAVFTGDFATEPYEAGWASEARWFVRLLDVERTFTGLVITPQLSPDGLVWCDAEIESVNLHEPGMATVAMRDFGPWLRLRGAVQGVDSHIKVLIYLTLKG